SAAPTCQRIKSIPRPSKRKAPRAVSKSRLCSANRRRQPQRYCQPRASMRRISAQLERSSEVGWGAEDNGAELWKQVFVAQIQFTDRPHFGTGCDRKFAGQE